MDPDLARMALKNWMHETIIPLWEQEMGTPAGTVDDHGYLLVPSGLILSLTEYFMDDVEEAEEDNPEFVGGAMAAMTAISEMIMAIADSSLPLTIPDMFGDLGGE